MELAKHPRPAYVRMTSCDGVNLHPDGYVFDASGVEKLFESACAAGVASADGVAVTEAAVTEATAVRIVSTPLPKRVTVLATGAITSRVVEAAQRAAEQIAAPVRTNIEVYGVSIHKLLDASLTEICQHSDVIITVEEHSVLGGFGSAVVEHLSASGACPQVIRVGMPDKYLEADVHHNILARAGLSVEGLQEVLLANC